MHDGRATDRPPGRPSDGPPVDQSARWISFNDLAALRGISRASASKLVRRHGRRRQTDNQGRVLILVPAEVLDRQTAGQSIGQTVGRCGFTPGPSGPLVHTDLGGSIGSDSRPPSRKLGQADALVDRHSGRFRLERLLMNGKVRPSAAAHHDGQEGRVTPLFRHSSPRWIRGVTDC
jgi:hypothetical protein